ncbi:coiled-coil domain-containing protein [Bacillus alkalicellulosilyticus]|uniref:coiled-coil domain-containing protein n=1 Tax=Alkalihalobacterium alkalicellulosilyticum TaxID=1912214 RepID=UPI000996A47D|nr:hypothetical protein [Bacillus alkalicellulosilyticus]
MKRTQKSSIKLLDSLRDSLNRSSFDLQNLIEEIQDTIDQEKQIEQNEEGSDKKNKKIEQLEKEIDLLKDEVKLGVEEKKSFEESIEKQNEEITDLKKALKKCITGNGNNTSPTPSGSATNEDVEFLNFVMPSIINSTRHTHWGSLERKSGLEQLKKIVGRAKELIVIDPYFYKGGFSEIENEEYISNIIDIINPSNITRLHIITNKRHISESIREELKSLYGTKISESFTNNIHDRIWIIDHHNACLVGTSLNGIGSKLAFILPLPYKDLESLKKELKDSKLLYDKDRRKRMKLNSLSLDDFIKRSSNRQIIAKFLIGN